MVYRLYSYQIYSVVFPIVYKLYNYVHGVTRCELFLTIVTLTELDWEKFEDFLFFILQSK